MNGQISKISETLNRLSRGMHRFATHGSGGVVAILVILVCFNLGSVLGQDLPSSPMPVAQQPTAPIGPAPSVPVAPGPPVPVGPQTGPYGPVQPGFIPPPPHPGIYANPYPEANGPLLRSDPLMEPVPNQPRGLFAGIEADLVWPHIKNRLTAPVTLEATASLSDLLRSAGFPGGLGVTRLLSDFHFTDTLHLPTASLDFTGSPLFILGYRFAPGYGEFTASYRSLVTEGGRNIDDFDILGEGFLKSRLNVNVVDLDYGSQDIPLVTELPGQLWDLKFDVGARIAGVYFDSIASGFALRQETSNNFFGAGPHLKLEVHRYLQDFNGLALYGKVETAVVIGSIQQHFRESFSVDGITLLSGSTTHSGTQAVPTLGIEAGLSWTPKYTLRWLRFTGGYTFEQWWNVGTIGGSSADLTYQGLFLRTELHF